MLVYFTVRCLVYLLKQRPDIRSRDSQFSVCLPVGCEDEVSSGRVTLVFENDKRSDCSTAFFLIADVAEFVDKRAEHLLWILDIDVWLGGWRLSGVFHCVDESLVEYDWLIEFEIGFARGWNWLFCGHVQR